MQLVDVEAALGAWRHSLHNLRTNSPGAYQTKSPGPCKPLLNDGGTTDHSYDL